MSIAIRMRAGSVGTVTQASHRSSGQGSWMDVDWRAHQRWLRIQDRWANVCELGSGPPVLFVHGLGGSWQNWLENLVQTADAGYRAIAVDLPGFGRSELPVEKVSISGYGRWIDELLTALEVEEPVALVGNSMGGFIGCEVAIQFPARVERLVLVSAAGISIEHERNDTAMAALYRTEVITMYLTTWVATRSERLSTRPGLRRALL